jgi:hypothetical protein
MRNTAIACLAIGMLASAPALAKERMHRDDPHRGKVHSNAIDMLEDRDEALQRRANTIRIGAVERQEIAEQRQHIDALIDDLEVGKTVNPHELDEALEYPYHGYLYRHHDHRSEPYRG